MLKKLGFKKQASIDSDIYKLMKPRFQAMDVRTFKDIEDALSKDKVFAKNITKIMSKYPQEKFNAKLQSFMQRHMFERLKKPSKLQRRAMNIQTQYTNRHPEI